MYQMATEPENRYSNYFDYAIQLCGNGSNTTVECIYAPYGRICEKITFSFKKGDIQYDLANFASMKTEYLKPLNKGYTGIEIQLSQGPADLESVEISITTSRDRISFTSNAKDLGFDLHIHGYNTFGNGDSISAVCLEREGIDLRSSFGPSASKIDDTLFCRETDNALRFFSNDTFRLHYDFTEDSFAFSAINHLCIWAEEDIFRKIFHVKYKGINKNSTFRTPPAVG